MKITKRQLRRIIREEKARILSENLGFNPNPVERETGIASEFPAETMEELREIEAFDKIQDGATTAALEMDNLLNEFQIPLQDAGVHDLVKDIKKSVELLDKIRNAAYDLRR